LDWSVGRSDKMYLTLKVVQQPGEGSGIIEVHKRKTVTCTVKIGAVAFADDDEKRFLINLLTQNGSAGDVWGKTC